MTWTNSDGLQVLMHGEQGEVNNKGVTVNSEDSQLVVDVDLTSLSATPSQLDPFIPAGAFITSAYLIVTEAAAGGTSVTLGLYEKDGTAIDADGIDAAVATAALAANKAVVCDGDAVGGTVTVGADDAYFGATAVGTFTAGKAKLVVDYITV